MADPTTPGWHPDPQQPGMLRWWNGLGWSDARRAVDAARDRATAIRPVAEDDARLGTGLLEAARKAAEAPGAAVRNAGRDAARAASAAGGATAGAATTAAAAATNPFAGGAIALGVVGLIAGGLGLLPLVGLVVSIAGLVRSRRLARQGARRTGLGQSVAGLLLSVVGLIRWIPAGIAVLQSTGFQVS